MVHSTPMQMVLPGLDFSPLECEESPLDGREKTTGPIADSTAVESSKKNANSAGASDSVPGSSVGALAPLLASEESPSALSRDSERRAESMFRVAHLELKPRTEVPRIEVQFCSFAGASARVRLLQGQLKVKLSDMLQDSPDEALASLSFILLSKLFRRPVAKERAAPYRQYLAEEEVRTRIGKLRRERGRKVMSDAKGMCFDLQEIFDRVNGKYFGGEVQVEALGWSRQFSRTTLGHYDSAHRAIVISKLLDGPRVPPVILEFLMYHEMLHVRFPVEHVGGGSGKRRIHTREFRAAERQFERYAEAKLAIRRYLN